MKIRIITLLATVMFLSSGFSQNRLRIGKKLQKSAVAGSIVVTDASRDQTYVEAGTEGQVLAIVGGVPAWSSSSGEATTVTDQVNGLDISLTGADIMIAPNFAELTQLATIDNTNDRVMIYDMSSGNHFYVLPTQLASGSDQNYATNDLTATGDRFHTWSTFNLTETFSIGDYTIANDGSASAFKVDGTTGTIDFGAYGNGIHVGTVAFNLGVDAAGNVIEVPAGGASQDYATADLTADANRLHTWNNFNQTELFTSGDFTISNTGSPTALNVDGATGDFTLGKYSENNIPYFGTGGLLSEQTDPNKGFTYDGNNLNVQRDANSFVQSDGSTVQLLNFSNTGSINTVEFLVARGDIANGLPSQNDDRIGYMGWTYFDSNNNFSRNNAGIVAEVGDATDGVETSRMIFYNNNGGSSTAINTASYTLELTTDQSVKLNQYGGGTKTGTPTFNLSVNASGEIIETPVSSGDTNYALNDLTADANRGHFWNTFNLSEIFTSGDYIMSNNGSPTAFTVDGATANITFGKYTENNVPYFGTGGLVSEQTDAGKAFTYDGTTLTVRGSDNFASFISGGNIQTARYENSSGINTFEFFKARGDLDNRLPVVAGDGIGLLGFTYVDDNGDFARNNSGFFSEVVDPSNGVETSRLILYNSNDGTGTGIAGDHFTITLVENNSVRFDQYGTGAFTGTAAFNLSVDASGNIIETPIVSGVAVNEVADIAARDAIVSPSLGDVAIIESVNICEEDGLSWYNGTAWTTPKTLISPENHSNTLYVDPNGDNSKAVKGNSHWPYREVWSAIAAASKGDLIIVNAGDYTVGGIGSGADYENDINDPTIGVKDGVTVHFMKGARIRHITPDFASACFKITPAANENVSMTITGHLTYDGGDSNLFFFTIDEPTANLNFNIQMDSLIMNDNFGHGFGFRSGVRSFNLDIKYADTGAFPDNNQPGQIVRIRPSSPNIADGVVAKVKIDHVKYSYTRAGGDNGTICLLRNLINSNIDIQIGNVTGTYHGSAALLSVSIFGGNVENNNINYRVGNMRLLNPSVVNGTHTGFVYDATTEMSGNGSDLQNTASGTFFLYNQNATGDWKNNNVTLDIGNISGHVGLSPYYNLRPEIATANNVVSCSAGNITMEDDYPAVFLDTRNGGGQNLGGFSLRVKDLATSTSVPIRTSRFGTDDHTLELSGRFKSDDLTLPVFEYHENWTNKMIFRDAILLSSNTVGAVVPRVAGNPLNVVVYNSYTNNPNVSPDVTEQVSPFIRDANVR